jgi:hypothetical protein
MCDLKVQALRTGWERLRAINDCDKFPIDGKRQFLCRPYYREPMRSARNSVK